MFLICQCNREIVLRSLLILQASWAQISFCNVAYSTNRHEVQLIGFWHVSVARMDAKCAEICMVCQFIVEISVKKPANCDSRMTRFFVFFCVNSVKMHICSF